MALTEAQALVADCLPDARPGYVSAIGWADLVAHARGGLTIAAIARARGVSVTAVRGNVDAAARRIARQAALAAFPLVDWRAAQRLWEAGFRSGTDVGLAHDERLRRVLHDPPGHMFPRDLTDEEQAAAWLAGVRRVYPATTVDIAAKAHKWDLLCALAADPAADSRGLAWAIAEVEALAAV